jgi:hypothetical protein
MKRLTWIWITRAHVFVFALVGVMLQLVWKNTNTLRIIDAAIFSGIAVDVFVHNYDHLKSWFIRKFLMFRS